VSRNSIIVTGGAGFIGSELVRQLTADESHVVVIDNLTNGKRENLVEVQGRITLLEYDIRDVSAYAPILRDAAIVYHLACLGVRHSVHSPLENHDVNASGTLRLLEASRASGVPKFVYVSSSEVYGSAQRVPMTEDHPTFPSTVYGGSKLAGEAYTRAYHRTYGFPTVVVRPFNTYGPRSHHEGDSGEVIPKFMLRCLAGKPMVVFGDGTQTRDFTYVSDSARGIILAATTAAAIGRTLNLGSGFELSMNELARTIAEITNTPDAEIVHEEARPGDVLRLCADMSHAKTLLGYAPQVRLEQGLAQLLDWYKKQAVSPEQLLRDEVVRNWDVNPVRG
jgi:UDP-glucose 4-epimerase